MSSIFQLATLNFSQVNIYFIKGKYLQKLLVHVPTYLQNARTRHLT